MKELQSRSYGRTLEIVLLLRAESTMKLPGFWNEAEISQALIPRFPDYESLG